MALFYCNHIVFFYASQEWKLYVDGESIKPGAKVGVYYLNEIVEAINKRQNI